MYNTPQTQTKYLPTYSSRPIDSNKQHAMGLHVGGNIMLNKKM